MTNALVIYDINNKNVIHQSGDIDTRHAPCSTFKIPLAVMGFDNGILASPSEPLIPYDSAIGAPAREHISCSPQIWLDKSIIWYSQFITTQLGEDRFRSYVQRFAYGNQDVSGDPGKNNGLTRSWLSSSLQISPIEQIKFIERFINHDLGVNDFVYDLVKNSMPKFSQNDWVIWGKTGSGFLQDQNLVPNTIHPMGWFVGWAQNKHEIIAFAKFIDELSPMGTRARDEFLAHEFSILTN